MGTERFRDLGSASSTWTRIWSKALGLEENLKKEMETDRHPVVLPGLTWRSGKKGIDFKEML